MNEASILVRLEHENVIQFLGYCIHGRKGYLLYDFAPYATLEGLISDPKCNVLDWSKRYNIILGIARALVYLHNYAPTRIIHRAVSPSNIVLDGSLNPKLSGFGLATAVNETDYIRVYLIRGTYGYMAPEYRIDACVSTKTDVFSFGVLILEIITGQRSHDLSRFDEAMLFNYVRLGYVMAHLCLYNLYSRKYMHSNLLNQTHHFLSTLPLISKNWVKGTLPDIIDPRIDGDPVLMTKLIELGLLCVQRDVAVRPTMEEVVDMLLGSSSLTPHVLEMLKRMINGEAQTDSGSLCVRDRADSVRQYII
ncbi:putative non-specific protein-tyrosine kinase RLK-Pelle-DLSV family [Helianthus annuus]|nr:putative non-specific protein-tyrosine kinase RLK-Pelle-DLSV family [Helianthus annuus]